MAKYSLETLPLEAKALITRSYLLKNKESIIRGRMKDDLFALFPIESKSVEIKTCGIIWGTDNYENLGHNFTDEIKDDSFELIIPRTLKAKEEQKKRTKEKAEVFTPSWVCNMQNNLVDDHELYEGAFNVSDQSTKSWTPSFSPVNFNEDYTWLHYVLSKRLEITCGEGPYLMSPYDTTTGDEISVKDSEGRFNRIGLLDRKFRIIAENSNQDQWIELALMALKATYGYEWQGDNLLLARLNMINTFIDYYEDFFNKEFDDLNLLLKVTEIASWQLWQMDGLKMVTPLSCTEDCKACLLKTKTNHTGEIPLLRWGDEVRTFESFIPIENSNAKHKL